MNLYGSQNSRKQDESEVDMTAVMNIFLILIPFLLLMAVFAKIAVLELSLPTGGGGGEGAPPPGKAMLVFIVITANGDMRIQTGTESTQFPIIYAKPNGEYDYDTLVEQLSRLKAEFPWLEELILRPEETVKYDVIIKVMDRSREQGFPNVALA